MSLPGIYPIFQHWAKQTVWIYSDPHFSDEGLEYGIKNRPSDEEQIKMINSCVGRKDTLIILGDVGNIECVRRLRGYKVLIMGNHDAGRTNYERKIEHYAFDKDTCTKEKAMKIMAEQYPGWEIHASLEHNLVNMPFEYWDVAADNKLFDEVYEGALIVGEKLILSHEPVNIPWLFNIHGHVHSKDAKEDLYHINVCSDVIGYKPKSLNCILKYSGILSKVESLHRVTIDKATDRKRKKEKK